MQSFLQTIYIRMRVHACTHTHKRRVHTFCFMTIKIKTYVLGSQSHEIMTPITFSKKLTVFDKMQAYNKKCTAYV
jgi:hypothetical protein